MGSISAMDSIARVLEKHGDEIRKEYEEGVPEILKPLFREVSLSNEVYSIRVTWVFKDDSVLMGPEIDIDTLADQYPDCEVGY